jgi:hypothetical protein
MTFQEELRVWFPMPYWARVTFGALFGMATCAFHEPFPGIGPWSGLPTFFLWFMGSSVAWYVAFSVFSVVVCVLIGRTKASGFFVGNTPKEREK